MNLSRVLVYRSQIVEAFRIELAAAARLLQEAAERSVSCEGEVVAKQQRYADAAMNGLTVDETHRWYAEIDMASIKAGRAVEVHTALHGDWMAKQAALLEAMQERKKLDILVRRRREAREEEQLREDQRLMDEQAARRRRGDVGRAAQSGSDLHG